MACLGGTLQEPKVWYDRHDNKRVGRPCAGLPKGERRSRFTSISYCSSCIAYRGPLRKRRPGESAADVPQIGALFPDGQIHNTTQAEQDALWDRFDGDPEPWFEWLWDSRSPLTDASRPSFRDVDDEAAAVWREYMREYRKRIGSRQVAAEARYRERNRALLAEKARARRAAERSQKAAQTQTLNTEIAL